MDILTDILGMQAEYDEWEKSSMLPSYMPETYTFKKAVIEGVACIIMELQADFPTLPGIKRQIRVMQSIENLPAVLQVDSMSAFRRKSLIQEKIPFIIRGKQIYLPFLGAYLLAKDVKKREESPTLEKFMYSTQQLLLWYLYQPKSRLYVSEAVKVLPFTAMTLTRAARQLEAAHLFEARKEGVNKVLETSMNKLQVYEKAKPYMRTPVKYEGYADRELVVREMVLAGDSARRSYANSERKRIAVLKTYACAEEFFNKDELVEDLIDIEWQHKVEIWAYDPRLFGKEGEADPISVELSFAGRGEMRGAEDRFERIRSKLT